MANGTAPTTVPGLPGLRSLSLFTAERVDLGLQRLAHYWCVRESGGGRKGWAPSDMRQC
jgi:hypothetical protein